MAALAQPAEAREAWLRTECGEDEQLLVEVLDLLRRRGKQSDFLEPTPSLTDAARKAGFEPGATLGDFRIVRQIGMGGMGAVFLAEQISLRRRVALKVLPPRLFLQPREVDRFRREAAAAARLQHEGIVRVHVVDHDDERDFFAMEYVDGHDLAEELRRIRRAAGILTARGNDTESDTAAVPAHAPPFREAAYARFAAGLVSHVAEALQHAHEQGVVHRDVKPHNLLLDAEGRVFVADFGLARDEHLGSMSGSAELMGTAHYMSPEQIAAHRRGVDHRTDVYSLGVVLYELLTLHRPFDGQTRKEVLERIPRGKPRAVSHLNGRVPRDLEVICHKAMAPVREDRYSTARELAEDLTRFLAHEAIRARPLPWHQTLWRNVVRQRVAIGLTVAGFAVATVLMLLYRQSEERADARDLTDDVRALVADFETADRTAIDELLVRSTDMRRRHGRLDSALEADLATLAERREEKLGRLDTAAIEALGLSATARRTVQTVAAVEGRRTDADALRAVTEAALYRGELDRAMARELVRRATVRFTLDVRGADPREVRVDVSRYNTASDSYDPPRLATLALASPIEVAPGFYRVAVTHARAGFAELDLDLLEPGHDYAAITWLRSNDVSSDMQPVEAATVTIPGDRYDDENVLTATTLTRRVEAFFIDPLPVTNARFEAFLRATDRPDPPHWAHARDEAWPERPVTWIPFADARAYAAWSGKRLPTLAEWLLAARGPEPRQFPWGNDEQPQLLPLFRLDQQHFHEQAELRVRGVEGIATWCARALRPVRSATGLEGGPHGLGELIGQVAEWTEQIPSDQFGGETLLMTMSKVAIGTRATATPDLVTLRGFEQLSTFPITGRYFDLGFRCVRSVAPRVTDR